MKVQLIAALLVAVSSAVAAPAFANEATVTRAQVRAELAQLQHVGYPLNRATDATYPNDLQAALTMPSRPTHRRPATAATATPRRNPAAGTSPAWPSARCTSVTERPHGT